MNNIELYGLKLHAWLKKSTSGLRTQLIHGNNDDMLKEIRKALIAGDTIIIEDISDFCADIKYFLHQH